MGKSQIGQPFGNALFDPVHGDDWGIVHDCFTHISWLMDGHSPTYGYMLAFDRSQHVIVYIVYRSNYIDGTVGITTSCGTTSQDILCNCLPMTMKLLVSIDTNA